MWWSGIKSNTDIDIDKYNIDFIIVFWLLENLIIQISMWKETLILILISVIMILIIIL